MAFSIGEVVVLAAGVCGILFAWVAERGAHAADKVMSLADWFAMDIPEPSAEWQEVERKANEALRAARASLDAQWLEAQRSATLVATTQAWLDIAVGDSVRVYKCDGCDQVRFRDHVGYVKVCDGIEFCSEQCRNNPQPFPALPLRKNRERSLDAPMN